MSLFSVHDGLPSTVPSHTAHIHEMNEVAGSESNTMKETLSAPAAKPRRTPPAAIDLSSSPSPSASSKPTTLTVPPTARLPSDPPLDPDAPQDWSKIVKVLVGPQRKSFIVHQSTIIKIPFFRLCLRNDMIEAAHGQIHLPEDSPSVFSEILSYVYGQKISFDLPSLYEIGRCDAITDSSNQTDATHGKMGLLVKVYILAKKFGIINLQALAIDQVRRSTKYVRIGSQCMKDIQHDTEEDDQLRLLALYEKGRNVKKDGWDKWSKSKTFNLWAKTDAEASNMLAGALANFVDEGPVWKEKNASRWQILADASVPGAEKE